MKKFIQYIIFALGFIQLNSSCTSKMKEPRTDMGETYLTNLEYKDFEKWVDAALSVELPANIEAFCFNLYEKGNNVYAVEIIGSPSFDEAVEDWACDEVFNNRDYPLLWKNDKSWEAALEEAKILVKRYLKEGKYDIVCTFLPDMSLMSRLASFGTKTIVVSAERGDPFEFSKLWKSLIGWTYRKSDYCFFQLDRARDFFGQEVAKHSFVIPNPYVPVEGATSFSGTRKKTIVSAGRFADQKRFDILIQAFAKVHEKHPDYKLVLYGEGECKAKYEELSRNLGIDRYIEYPGYVKNVSAAIREDSVFVLSSDYEGIPNSLIEAMTVGLPCVATDCTPGGPDFLTDSGKRGLLVPIRDVDAMTEAINRIIESPELAANLSREGVKLVDILDINVINKAWVDAFSTMISNRDGRKES